MKDQAHYLERMKELAKMGDYESSHWMADELLCEILKDMGWNLVADEFEKMEKWYA